MKNEGFTLVELLAVLLILAFIALIAVPQILNLIEQSKIKSLKISTSEYIRAVNTSLINEEVFNNVKDGLYTIEDDGKKIVLGDKEIYIASEGHGLRSGLLLIEDSKVKRVLKGMIDDYYARVTDDDITILKNLNENIIIDGSKFNAKVKQLVGDTKDDGSVPDYNTVDNIIKKIIFLQDSVLPEGYTKETLETLNHIDLSQDSNESIMGYYDDKTGTIYVYSDGYISFPKDTTRIFQNLHILEEVELNLIDTSNGTNMNSMFNGCTVLKNINLIGIDTSKVPVMDAMFLGCSGLIQLDLSKWNTPLVTNMASMFEDCTNLKSIKFGKNCTFEKLIDMNRMFMNCNSLIELDLSSFDTSQVTTMQNMFNNCINLKKIKGLDKFNTKNVENMATMFAFCNNLTEMDVSNFNTESVKNMGGMFRGCSSLTKLDLNNWNTSQVMNMVGMFSACSSLIELDLSNFDTRNVEGGIGEFWSSLFRDCTNLTRITFGKNCTFEKVTSMIQMFSGCSSLKEIIGLENFNTSNVTDMGSMFENCSSLTELNLSSFNTSKVTYMRGMFVYCRSLKELDLRSFDMNSDTNVISIFGECNNLETIKVTKDKWNININDKRIKYFDTDGNEVNI